MLTTWNVLNSLRGEERVRVRGRERRRNEMYQQRADQAGLEGLAKPQLFVIASYVRTYWAFAELVAVQPISEEWGWAGRKSGERQ